MSPHEVPIMYLLQDGSLMRLCHRQHVRCNFWFWRIKRIIIKYIILGNTGTKSILSCVRKTIVCWLTEDASDLTNNKARQLEIGAHRINSKQTTKNSQKFSKGCLKFWPFLIIIAWTFAYLFDILLEFCEKQSITDVFILSSNLYLFSPKMYW